MQVEAEAARRGSTGVPLHCVDLYVDLTEAEQRSWLRTGAELDAILERLASRRALDADDPDRLLRRLGRMSADGDSFAALALRVARDRCRLVQDASARRRCVRAVVRWLLEEGHRPVVFHDSITAAESIAEDVTRLGGIAVVDHDQRSPQDRALDIGRFREAQAGVLVAVRPEEGADRIPDASVSVVVCGSRSPRQRLARLEPAGRGEPARSGLAVSILVRGTPEETFVGAGDRALLGDDRVAHHRWPAVEVCDAVVRPSTYPVDAAVEGLGDLLTASALGVGRRRSAVVVDLCGDPRSVDECLSMTD